MRRRVAVVVAALGLIALLLAAFPRVAAICIVRPYRRDDDARTTPGQWAAIRDAGIDARPLDFEGDGNVALHGWRFVPRGGDATRIVIYLHGIADCGLSGLGLAVPLAAHGIELIVFDQRAHGKSGGSGCTYGVLEKRDASRLLDCLAARDSGGTHARVGIYGASMGAAIAIQAAAFDHRVEALVAQSSFCELRSVAHAYFCRFLKLDCPGICDSILARAEQVGRFHVDEVAPIRAVADVRCPILFVAGDKDLKISWKNTQRLFEAATAPKQLLVIPGAGHDDVFEVGGDSYVQTLVTFFDETLR